MDTADIIRVFSSSRRMELLNALNSGKTKKEIKKEFPGSTYAFTADYLKKCGMIRESNGALTLTDSGKTFLVIFDNASRSLETYCRITESFPEHRISIPEEFLVRLSELKEFELVSSEHSDILKPHRVFTEYLMRSNEIYGVSPILFPDYPEIFSGITGEAKTVSLVITEEIYNSISGYLIGDCKNLNLYIIEPPVDIAFTVSNIFLSIGFFYNSGSYDYTRDLIATSNEALLFGRNLFDYYRAQSRKVL